MGNAGRDPIFWATMAIAEQDHDGVGDLCIRCHSTGGWYGGRSTPTDASGLASSDSDGVDCDTCHSMTNTDDSEFQGEMNAPFVANCSDDLVTPNGACGTDTEGYYGSGMTSMWSGSDKLGPYADADARHQFMQSKFHRSVDFCGSCHDVSNSVVGDLAPGNGAQPDSPHVVSSQDLTGAPNLGGPVDEKAAFNNPPYAYGVVERTFSEYKSSLLPETLVSAFNTLPEDLKVPGGSLDVTYQAALAAGTSGNYEDGDPRYFSCQSCHMRPTTSAGANKRGVQIRPDLPQHDHTGGNYWLADMIRYQDSKGQLRLGGILNSVQLNAIDLGQQRAVEHLRQAADLSVVGNTLKVVNLTGHKLISGYPEGRRMWLNIKWYDDSNTLLREDGEYGYIKDENDEYVQVLNPADGSLVNVESIVDLDDPNTRIYQAHYAMTQEWAATLIGVGKPHDLALSYDRNNGSIDTYLVDLANAEPGEYEETFHFALNNFVTEDNRIPPYGMRYDEAKKRNALPVPADQYGTGQPGSTYNYWDEIDLNQLKPTGAVFAEITLYYQGTSWEYIQFLNLANNGQNAFLGAEGVNMLEAWINAELPETSGAILVNGDRKMVPPVVMQQTTWGAPPGVNSAPTCSIDQPAGNVTIDVGASINYMATANDSDGTIASYYWSFPGGSPGSSSAEDPGNVIYSTAGVYETSFSATDNDGASCNASVTITVGATNTPPLCSIDSPTGNMTINEGQSVDYAGTATDSDGSIASYAWSFPGGAPGLSTLEDPGAVIYSTAGVFTTTFTASDGAASCNADTVTITVQGAVLACSDYADRTSCKNDPNCTWNNKNKICLDK
jgi:hypothetical protein